MKNFQFRSGVGIIKLFLLAVTTSFFTFHQSKAQNCTNLDFELNNFTNWVGYTGSCCPVAMTSTGFNITGINDMPQHVIMSGSGTDPNTDDPTSIPVPGAEFPFIRPGGGLHSMRLGNSIGNSHAERAEYMVNVDQSNSLVTVWFACVFDDHAHLAAMEPAFTIEVTNSSGQTINCGGNLRVSKTNHIQGMYNSTSGFAGFLCVKWTCISYDLSSYTGQNIKFSFQTNDCGNGGHFAYAYIDASCGEFNINQQWCHGSTVATLVAPTGFTGYSWTGPGITTPVTTPSLTIPSAVNGNTYTCVVTSWFGCTSTLTSTLSQSQLTASFSDSSACLLHKFTDLSTFSSGNPISSYQWTFGDGDSSNIQNPIHVYSVPGNYNVNLTLTNNSGCTSSMTLPVTVSDTNHLLLSLMTFNGGPGCQNFQIPLSSLIMPAGLSGIQYLWTGPSGFSSTLQNPVVSPSITSTYSLTVSQAYCKAMASTTVSIVPTPSISVSNTGPACPGSSISLNAIGSMGSLYLWSGPAGYSTTVQNPSVILGTNSYGTYTVTVTNTGGCTNSASTIIVSPQPPSSAFSVTQSLCESDSALLVYSGPGQSGVTYYYTISGTYTPNPLPAGPGPFYIHWTGTGIQNISLATWFNGCQISTSTTYHQLNVVASGTTGCCTAPAPVAGNDDTICGLAYTLHGSVPYAGNSCVWTKATGPGTAVFTDSTLSSSSVTVSTSGIYIFRWNETSGSCMAYDSVAVNFLAIPAPVAGADIDTCGNTCIMHAVQGAGTSLWTGPGSFSNPGSSSSTVTSLTGSGTFPFIWNQTITTGSFSCHGNDTVMVTFRTIPQPNPGINDSACGTIYHLNADHTFPGFWSSAGNVTFNPSNTDPNATATLNSFNGYSKKAVNLTWTESNNTCTGSSNLTLTFLNPPHAEAGIDTFVCTHSGHYINADTLGSGATGGYWTTTYNNVNFSSATAVSPVLSLTSYTSADYGWNSVISAKFFWHAQNSHLCETIDSAKVTFLQQPVANAGPDDSVCGKVYNLNVQTSIYNAFVLRSLVSGPGTAIFNPINDPESTVTVNTYGTYTFNYNEYNRSLLACYASDTISVKFMPLPVVNAGNDTAVCGSWAHLHAQIPSGVNGFWYSVYGGTAWFDTINGNSGTSYAHNPDVYARYTSHNDTVVYYFQGYQSICAAYDSVKVYFGSTQPAMLLMNAADSTNCGETTILNAQAPAYGFGQWTDTSSGTHFYPSDHAPNPDSVVVSSYGYHSFRWIVTNGTCTDTTPYFNINFRRIPHADAGGHYWADLFGPGSDIKTDTICELRYRLNPVQSQWNGHWSLSDPIHSYFSSFGPGHSVSPIRNDTLVAIIPTYNQIPDYLQAIWCETNGNCNSSDTLRITFGATMFAMMDTSGFSNSQNHITPLNLSLVNQSVGATSYHWIFVDSSDAVIGESFNQNPSFTFNTGIYRIILVAINSLCQDTFIYNNFIVQSGIADLRKDNNLRMTISPNPNNGIFRLDMTTLNNDDVNIRILNSLGNEMFSNNIKINSKAVVNFNLKEIPAGIYTVLITGKNGEATAKLVKTN